MFYKPEFAIQHGVALSASLVLLIVSWRRPRAGRWLYALLFGWACAVNWYTALSHPGVYLEYGPLAIIDVYTRFIETVFALHILEMVGTIATCQGLIALGLVVGGGATRLALAGAIIFLLAIAPLGVGSGFPSTLLMAAGAFALLRSDACEHPLWRTRRTSHKSAGGAVVA